MVHFITFILLRSNSISGFKQLQKLDQISIQELL